MSYIFLCLHIRRNQERMSKDGRDELEQQEQLATNPIIISQGYLFIQKYFLSICYVIGTMGGSKWINRQVPILIRLTLQLDVILENFK